MKKARKYIVLIGFATLLFGVNSCRLFKGKNKCGDCPTWSQSTTEDPKDILRT